MQYTYHRADQPDPSGQPGLPGQPEQPRRRGSASVIAIIVGLLVIIGASMGTGIIIGKTIAPAGSSPGAKSFQTPSSEGGLGNNPTATLPAGNGGSVNAASVAANVDGGLVDINTILGSEDAQAAATGMVLTSNGLVLTNNHVVKGETSISVTDIGNGQTYDTVTVLGYDPTADVALIQIVGASGLKTVDLGNSNSVNPGEAVMGIGNAGGAGGTPSYATGSVVALGQSITASEDGNTSDTEQLSGMIESNADIQPGDSGGPLVNTSGQVIGMDTAGAQGSGGFGGGFGIPNETQEAYSIPINAALSIEKDIDKKNASSTVHIGGSSAFIGISVSAAQNSNGALIAGIVSGGPASSTSLQVGDVITKFDGQTVDNPSDLGNTILTPLRPGQTVPVVVTTQSGSSETVSVTLGSGPPQ